MKSNKRQAGRLDVALVVSFALHVWILFLPPFVRPAPDPPPPDLPTRSMRPLAVQLRPEPPLLRNEHTRAAPDAVADPAAAAVPPAPTFSPTKKVSAPQPQALRGQALSTALAALAKEAFYPHEAIERGWQGRVVLLLHLDAEGRVTHIQTAVGSGHAVLDDAAITAAARIRQLPGQRRQVLLPVDFQLD